MARNKQHRATWSRAAAGLVAACLAAPAMAQDTSVRSVAAERLNPGEAVLTDTYFGTVRARDITSLSYGVRGCVVDVSQAAKDTRTVTEGQVLVKLDDERSLLDLRTAEARALELSAAVEERQLAIEAAVADNRRRAEELAFVTKEFERNSTMLGRGLINESTMETIERRYMEARFAAERAGEAIANAEAAKRRAEIALEIGRLEQQSAKVNHTEYELAAPFNGVLVGFEANVGDCVQEGEQAARIYVSDQKSVDVFFLISRLSSPHASGLSTGADVMVTRVNGETCGGTITRLDTEADSETQFVEATVDVDESCAPRLFLNEAVEIEAVQGAVEHAFSVPNSAILGENTIFLVDEDQMRLQEVMVDVVMRGDRDTILRIPGAAGRLIVTSSLPSMADGQAVALREPG